MKTICIVFEDEERTKELINQLHIMGLEDLRLWFVNGGSLGFMESPPKDWIYFSRLSASAKLREHSNSLAYGRNILTWLEENECHVINGIRAFDLEVNKINQYFALSRFGFNIPESIAICGVKSMVDIVKERHPLHSFYIKPVTGGSGMGVRRFADVTRFTAETKNIRRFAKEISAPDQMYIFQVAKEELADWYKKHKNKLVGKRKIFYRAEFIGEVFHYLLRIQTPVIITSTCPKCDAPTRYDTDFDIVDPLDLVDDETEWTTFVSKCEALMKAYELSVCAFEFSIVDGEFWVYDLNTNTNYNEHAEKKMDLKSRGMYCVGSYLKQMALKTEPIESSI